MVYCLDCGGWFEWTGKCEGEECPNCHGNRLIKPMDERNEFQERTIEAEARIAALESKLAGVAKSIRYGQITDCPDCGFGVKVDEDGLCVMCGADAMIYCHRAYDLTPEAPCPGCAEKDIKIVEAIGWTSAFFCNLVAVGKGIPPKYDMVGLLAAYHKEHDAALAETGEAPGRRLIARVDGEIQSAGDTNYVSVVLPIDLESGLPIPVTVEVYADNGEGI